MKFADVATLAQPETLPYTSGVEHIAGEGLHVAVLTRMPTVAPEMVAWWFGSYMQTTEHYKRWHPRDHVWMDWENKQPGTHVGASHLVHEYIGGELNKLRITFVPQEEYFGRALDDLPGAVAICGKTALLEADLQLGRLVHLVVPTPWGSEMYSRFWLPEIAPIEMGRSLFVHCHEEMEILAGFLPQLHSSEGG